MQHNQRRLLEQSNQSMFITGNTIGGGFKRYPNFWKKYFLTLINLTIGGDRVQLILAPCEIRSKLTIKTPEQCQ